MSAYTPGLWRRGHDAGSIVSRDPGAVKEAMSHGKHGLDVTLAYGGALICESVQENNETLIMAAPGLLEACKVGDFIGNQGPFLLRCAAELVENFAPHTAKELRRKADMEEAAIARAEGG